MVREDGEGPAFKEILEMADGRVDRQKFTVESGISAFTGFESLGKKSKRFPGAVGELFQHGADPIPAGISGEGSGRQRVWVYQQGGGGEGLFGVLEGGGHGRGPDDGVPLGLPRRTP